MLWAGNKNDTPNLYAGRAQSFAAIRRDETRTNRRKYAESLDNWRNN